jgi:hypothetical protein
VLIMLVKVGSALERNPSPFQCQLASLFLSNEYVLYVIFNCGDIRALNSINELDKAALPVEPLEQVMFPYNSACLLHAQRTIRKG